MSDLDPFDLAAQEQAESDRKEAAKRDAQTEKNDLKWLMADPRGRRIVRRWLSQAGVWRLSFTGDPHTTAFNEGQRNGGLALFAKLSAVAPDRLAEMLIEDDHERTDDKSGN